MKYLLQKTKTIYEKSAILQFTKNNCSRIKQHKIYIDREHKASRKPQVIYIIYIPYSRPNSWTEWADIFFRKLRGIPGLTNIHHFQIFLFHGQRRALQLSIY